ncbi:hypothetical protein AWB76_07850 [Caballeronia temeraria]|uniref:CDI immunity protein domain-containing protein n=1 Tax=Caballeronia temeraria TaxID=1777137 RepID=A0A158E0P4_9BURK|nr:hypothetical protein [Caballeronia temeraria]SAL00384.1 hypothetical protein AWB76_07850 [Caballeronia temeraria]
MDYFKEAFGGFHPLFDQDAALKLALDVIFADHRLDDLISVISFEERVAGIGGEPGWIIEHREEFDEGWPQGSTFRSFVEPEVYPMENPEFYCDDKTFRRYVEAIANVYEVRHPERKQDLDRLKAALSGL